MAATTPTIGPFPGGMDNRRADYDLRGGRDVGDLLRNAVNVDLTNQGRARLRAGYQPSQSGLDCHSLWAPRSGAFGLYADAGDVFCVRTVAGALQRVQIAQGYGMTSAVSFAEVHEAVYFSDGLRVGSYHPVSGPTPAWVPQFGVEIQGRRLDALPAGHIVAFHRNRALVAVHDTLFYSEPFVPHLYDPAQNFMKLPGRIKVVACVEGGIAVCADQTYFYPGGVPSASMAAVLNYGAVEGTLTYQPGTGGGAAWMSPMGLVTLNKSGEIANVQEARVVVGTADRGASLYRRSNGLRQLISTLSDPGETKAGIGSFMEAEIVRKETLL